MLADGTTVDYIALDERQPARPLICATGCERNRGSTAGGYSAHCDFEARCTVLRVPDGLVNTAGFIEIEWDGEGLEILAVDLRDRGELLRQWAQ